MSNAHTRDRKSDVRTFPPVEEAFRALCLEERRPGLLAAVPLSEVRLLPEQEAYVLRKVARLGLTLEEVTALSLGMAYRRDEVEAIPGGWTSKKPADGRWDAYVRAYHDLNRRLNRVSKALADAFGGVAEGATREGIVGRVTHVRDYFPTCLSHRAVAEAAGLGWRGLHGLIVTPEFGPAFRLSTVLLPGRMEAERRTLPGCGNCRACIEVCPVLGKFWRQPDLDLYREGCRRRIKALALEADVCGICVRRCWEAVAPAVEWWRAGSQTSA